MDANEAALLKYMDKLEQDERDYEELLQMLRDQGPDADHEDYEAIIDSYGWVDYDLTEILEDI